MICKGFEHEARSLLSPRWCNSYNLLFHFVEAYTGWTFISQCYLLSKPLEYLGNVFPTVVKLPWFCALIAYLQTLWDSLNLWKLSPLDIHTYNHTFLKKSSMKVTKHLEPPIYVFLIRPYTLKCTISKSLVTRLPPSFKNAVICCLSVMHVFKATKKVF